MHDNPIHSEVHEPKNEMFLWQKVLHTLGSVRIHTGIVPPQDASGPPGRPPASPTRRPSLFFPDIRVHVESPTPARDAPPRLLLLRACATSQTVLDTWFVLDSEHSGARAEPHVHVHAAGPHLAPHHHRLLRRGRPSPAVTSSCWASHRDPGEPFVFPASSRRAPPETSSPRAPRGTSCPRALRGTSYPPGPPGDIIPPGPPGDIIRCWGPIMPCPMNPGGRIEPWPGFPMGMSWGPIPPPGPPGIPPIPCMGMPILGGPSPIMPCMGKPEGCGGLPPGLSPPPGEVGQSLAGLLRTGLSGTGRTRGCPRPPGASPRAGRRR